MKEMLAVALGGALGALVRYGVTNYIYSESHPMPYGTVVVNVVGCLLIGILSAYFMTHPSLPSYYRLFFITGGLGALTTFSTFAFESMNLLGSGHYSSAAMYIVGQLVMGIAICTIAFMGGKWLWS